MTINTLKIDDRELAAYFIVLSAFFFVLAWFVFDYSVVLLGIFIGIGTTNAVAALRLILILFGAADSPDHIEEHKDELKG